MILLDRWLGLADRFSRYAIWFGGALVLASAILVSVDVLIRKLFLISMGGADELSGYAFAIGTTWALAFTLLRRANVRVDALYTRLPQPVCAVLDIAALISLGLFIALLTWQAWSVLDTSLAFDARATTPLATPLWMPQILWLLGLILFMFTLIPLLLRAFFALLGGDLATVRRLAGARTIEEDAADEAAHTASLKPLD
ncbi:TRAP transporter small permease [uncultured Ferrovibrio sp.]|jgi:TRAP-type mannitol/chloroaromatic compound transport system permease small subunit|uniref:TRAP transporter small permease subunit n=1 Tax=uncultured Ferrovibrio sp. TaxID=1576913 RepID=UPI00262C2909|nr:TRAP transporter small permease [uncultured Ferrovibrio sp.]